MRNVKLMSILSITVIAAAALAVLFAGCGQQKADIEKIKGEQNLEQLVQNFYAALSAMDAERIVAFFAEDGRYVDRSMGWDMDREQFRAKVNSLAATWANASRVFRIELVSMAVKDNLVLTERMDHFESATENLAVPVASAIEFEDGKIRHMREYWDRATSGLSQPDATARANKAVVDRVFNEVYNGGNLDVVDELFAEDFALHMPGREVRGPDGVRDMVTVTRNGFPDIHFAIEDAFAAGDRVVHRYTFTGTHLADWHAIPKTGKQMSGIQGYCVSRLVGGKVAEMWELDDALSFLQQLGVVTLSAPMPRN